jgi:hypothetical protein
MDMACRTHGKDKKCVKILAVNPEGKKALGEDLCIDGRTIPKWTLGKQCKECELFSSAS